jgi:hypothetical protein
VSVVCVYVVFLKCVSVARVCSVSVVCVSVVCVKFHFNILISGKIIKEMPGSVASGTLCITRQAMYSNVTLRHVRATFVAVGKQ